VKPFTGIDSLQSHVFNESPKLTTKPMVSQERALLNVNYIDCDE